MNIQQSSLFAKKVKKLHASQKKELDSAVRKIIENPDAGQAKKGMLRNVRVYKFPMQKQLTLCAYMHPDTETIILLDFGSHENFYRALEKNPHI